MHSNVRKLQIQTKSNAYECIRKLQNTDEFEYLRMHPNVRELHNSYEFQFQCEFIRYSRYSSLSQSLDSLGAGLLAWSNLQSNQLLSFVLEVGLGVKLYCTCLPGGNWVRKGDWAEEGRHLRSSRRESSLLSRWIQALNMRFHLLLPAAAVTQQQQPLPAPVSTLYHHCLCHVCQHLYCQAQTVVLPPPVLHKVPVVMLLGLTGVTFQRGGKWSSRSSFPVLLQCLIHSFQAELAAAKGQTLILWLAVVLC